MTWCDFQVQYGYVVVQMLMEHLDHNSHESAKIKASVVGVLSEIVDISAGGSIGSSHLVLNDHNICLLFVVFRSIRA